MVNFHNERRRSNVPDEMTPAIKLRVMLEPLANNREVADEIAVKAKRMTTSKTGHLHTTVVDPDGSDEEWVEVVYGFNGSVRKGPFDSTVGRLERGIKEVEGVERTEMIVVAVNMARLFDEVWEV